MSAFANLKKQNGFCFPYPVPELSEHHVNTSSIHCTPTNSVFTPSSVILGLDASQFIVVKGCFSLRVRKGVCVVNNLHYVPEDTLIPVVVNASDSLPTIAATKGDGCSPEPTSSALFEDIYDTVIELHNWQNGLQEIAKFCPTFKGLYDQPGSEYTFSILQQPSDNSSAIFFDGNARKVMSSACKSDVIAVHGMGNSGKKTFSKALLNNMISATGQPVAYLDIDPSSPEAAVPNCLSIRIIKQFVFGEFLPSYQTTSSDQDKHCYFGYNHIKSKPLLYLQICKTLIHHFNDQLKALNIPLIVKYPSWLRGYGKELLKEIHSTLNPTISIFLTSDDAVKLDGFEPEKFEDADNPTLEVLSDMTPRNFITVSGTRRAHMIGKSDLLLRDKLLYFHQTASGVFDFSKALIEESPLILPMDYISAICILDLNSWEETQRSNIRMLLDATIVGIFATNVQVSKKARNGVLSGTDFVSLSPRFVGLCIIHSVDFTKRIYNIYIPNSAYISTGIQDAYSEGQSIILARGDSELPILEMTNSKSFPSDLELPYVCYDSKQKIGGVWRARRNLGRKNQST